MTKVIIDDFNATKSSPLIVQGSDPGPKSVVDNAGSGVLGTYRSATLSFIEGQEAAIVSYSITSNGQCSFNFGPRDSQAELTILWDANGAGLKADFSRLSELFVDIGSLDHPDVPITLTVHSQGQTYHQQVSIKRNGDGQTLEFPFSRFSPKPPATALANIAAIEMNVEGKTNMDLGINNIGASS